ncbi:MAG: hypothetical protein IPL28_03280 [Chloroflexi bacterium]|nr:hypothetical protein [Chloroflexota bacterium]
MKPHWTRRMGRPLYALYVRFRRSDEALVEDCYRTILQRSPDVAVSKSICTLWPQG